jgi:hypothetical protein
MCDSPVLLKVKNIEATGTISRSVATSPNLENFGQPNSDRNVWLKVDAWKLGSSSTGYARSVRTNVLGKPVLPLGLRPSLQLEVLEQR